MLLGAHVSIAGGFERAIERGEAMGATCIQTFASPPRTLQFNSLTPETIERYLQAKQNSSIQYHVFHAVYLVNLASEKPNYVKASVASLIQYQQAAGQLHGAGTIFHIGSHKGNGFESVKQQIAEAIIEVLDQSPIQTTLMVENAAGHKGTVGQTTEELAEIFELVAKQGGKMDQLGLCLDTQHAFASGVDGRDAEHLNLYLDQVDRIFGLSRLKVIHLNDSKVPFNSHHDRHENLGEGELGSFGLSNWLNHPKLSTLPFILEIPGKNKLGPAKADIELMRSFIHQQDLYV